MKSDSEMRRRLAEAQALLRNFDALPDGLDLWAEVRPHLTRAGKLSPAAALDLLRPTAPDAGTAGAAAPPLLDRPAGVGLADRPA